MSRTTGIERNAPAQENRAVQDLASKFQLLNDYLVQDGNADAARHRLLEMACGTIPGCQWAGITLWPQGKAPRTLSSTAEVAERVDRMQYEIGDGPCLSAAKDGVPVWIADLQLDTRWPRFATNVVERTPIRGVLAYHLTDPPQRSALNLYASKAGAFDQEAMTFGALFATHAAVLTMHAASANQAATLGDALTTSRQIGAAIGILMATHRVTEEVAFSILRRVSNQLNLKLRDVATTVTETGTLPKE